MATHQRQYGLAPKKLNYINISVNLPVWFWKKDRVPNSIYLVLNAFCLPLDMILLG